MGPVTAQIAIDAPRERVYKLLLDLSARPAFTDHLLKRYHLLRVDPVGVGAGARFYLREAGGWFDSVIDEAEEPYRIVERGRGGRLNRIPSLLEWRLTEVPGGGCEVAVTFWTQPEHPVDRVLELRRSQRRLAKGWREVLQRLRQLVEEERPVERLEVAGASRLGS